MALPRDHGAARAIPTTNRRTLLAGASAALVAAAAAAAARGAPADDPVQIVPAGADAELLALVAEFWREHAAVEAWNAGKMTWEEGERHNATWWACCRAMTDIAPTTAEGRTAKAAVALAAIEKVQDCQTDVEALVRAALAENGSRPQSNPTPNPDAELIAACSRMVAIRKELRAVAAADSWAPDHGPNHARYEGLLNELSALEDRAWEMDLPRSLAGIRAVARAAWHDAERTDKGDLIVNHFGDWLKLTTIEALAEGEVL